MRTLLVALLLVAFAGCERNVSPNSACAEKPRDPAVACYTLYAPVCGCNKKTYSNECEAAAHGITTYAPGECSKQ